MRVHLFLNGSDAAKAFRPLKRSRHYELSIWEPDDPWQALRECEGEAFAYVDVSHLETEEIVRFVRELQQVAACPLGIVYAHEQLEDPSQLFFAGVADVVGPGVLERGVTAKRMNEVLRYARRSGLIERDETLLEEPERDDGGTGVARGEQTERGHYIVSGSDWSGIEPGGEYSFWLLFVELDDVNLYSRHKSDTHNEELFSAFRRNLVDAASPYGARVWTWKQSGGVFLFPFDGERCTPIVPMMRLALNHAISNVEDYPTDSGLTYRMALHLGNTVYHGEGRTGTVVSETVNFVFHLGQRFLAPGEIAITGEAFSFLPEALTPYFKASESFESHQVYRLRPFQRGA
ncbi:MAG: hypothetical protein ACQETQ_07560 [Spirochaetota bacterium]